MITLNDIKDAKKRLENTISKTPLMKAPILSKEKNAEIFLKEDNLQITGSFKLRGAFNKVAMLDDAKRKAGVVAASAGNHAQGLAFAAQYFGCVATIFMPEATPLTKVSGVRSYGAEVVLVGENFDEAYEKELIKLTKIKVFQGEFKGLYRLKLRTYRVVYEKINNKLVILVLRVSHRKDVYR